MSVDFKNWQNICKEKDERIKELEGKFDLIVEKLGEEKSNLTSWAEDVAFKIGIEKAIEIVKGVINERE